MYRSNFKAGGCEAIVNAAVWKGANQVDIDDIPIPEPRENEALIRVKSVGVCMTDIHIIQGSFAYTSPPHVLGHEIAGVVARDAGAYREGDRVVISTAVGCGKCYFCQNGMKFFCKEGGEIGYAPYQGGYAEYLCAPLDNLLRLPDNIGFDEGAVFESFVCPFGAVYNCGSLLGATTLIFGAGPAGLAFILSAKAAGAGKIIVAARNPVRLAQAAAFGADAVVDVTREDVKNAVRKETGGLDPDVVIEAAGTQQSIADAISLTRRGGKVLLYGIPGSDKAIPFPVNDIVTNQITVIGTMGNTGVWQLALDLLETGRISLAGLVTHRFPLERFKDALDLVANKRDGVIKAVIHP